MRKLFQFSLVMLFLFGVVFLSFVDDANSSQPSAEAIKEQVELFKKKLSERGEQAEKETFDIHKASGLSKKMQPNRISNKLLSTGGQKETEEDLFEEKAHYKKNDLMQANAFVSKEKIFNRQIIIKFISETELTANDFGCEPVEIPETLRKRNILLVRVPEGADLEKTLAAIRQHPDVKYAEFDVLNEMQVIPSDPHYFQQWHLPKIDMPGAWNVTTGSPDVVVAVLDTGVDFSHPDLKGRLLPGVDWYYRDRDPADDDGHGTFVSGIVAANRNTMGVAGIDWNCKIMPVKVGGPNGFPVSMVAYGIYSAIDSGADIINMSFGGYVDSGIKSEAIWEAYREGIITVAACGNDSSLEPMYPASYLPVISVGASNQSDERAYFSNYGYYMDLLAPGTDIYSTSLGGGYKSDNGTSFSAPIVSGICALLKAEHPNWSSAEIEWALEASCDKIGLGSGWNPDCGYGRVNAYKALTISLPNMRNDAPNYRKEAKPITSGFSYSEEIELPMDDDWFRFEVEENSNVTIEITNVPDELDLLISLRKYQGDILVGRETIDSEGLGGGERADFELSPGTYYLWIYDCYNHWSEDPYSISVDISPWQPAPEGELVMEVEPNDTCYYAGSMNFSDFGAGYFDNIYDYDYFKVFFPYYGNVEITTCISENAFGAIPAALLMNEHLNFVDVDTITDFYNDGYYFVSQKFTGITPGYYYVIMCNAGDYNYSAYPYVFGLRYIGDISGELAVPEASVKSGTYFAAFDVTLSTLESGASIKYTLDGSTPGISNGTTYTKPVHIDTSCTLKAVTVKDGRTIDVVTYNYTVELLNLDPPEADPAPGTYGHPVKVGLSAQKGTTIIFTLDGSTPTLSNGFIYSEPFLVEESATVKAIAVKGNAKSDVASFKYTIDTTAPGNGSEEPLVWESKTTDDKYKVWTIRFNLPVDAGTINSRNITVTGAGGNQVDVIVEPGGDGRSATVTPVEAYTAGKVYYLNIGKGIKSTSGKSLKRPVIMQFQVASSNP